MSFSGNLREELSQVIPSRRTGREAALAALLINIGSFSRTEDGRILLSLSHGNIIAIRKCFTLIQKNVNISPDSLAPRISIYGFGKPDRGGTDTRRYESGTRGGKSEGKKIIDDHDAAVPEAVFLLSGTEMMPDGEGEKEAGGHFQTLPRQFTSLMIRLQLIGENGALCVNDGTIPASIVKGAAGRAYLREMFLCNGFMSDPKKRYHLEFRCFSQRMADQLREVLGEQGIHAGLTLRKKYFVVYLKDSEDIVMLLQLMGASVSLMAMENARIYKDVRNNVNRRVNCETANIGKTVESAARQLEDIRLLREKGILQDLPKQLREAAALREEHPGASLSELGELADPPVGRSGMNHRMRKLASLTQKIQQ